LGVNFLIIPLDGLDLSTSNPQLSSPASGTALVDKARRILRFRLSRSEYLPGLMAEPGWDMLLTAFIADSEGHKSPVTSICAGAACPPTTALRWIKLLERRGLFERTPDPTDSRRSFLALSEKGRSIMEVVLASAP